MCVCENENTVFVGFTVFEQNFPEQNGIHLQNVLYWCNSTTVQQFSTPYGKHFRWARFKRTYLRQFGMNSTSD